MNNTQQRNANKRDFEPTSKAFWLQRIFYGIAFSWVFLAVECLFNKQFRCIFALSLIHCALDSNHRAIASTVSNTAAENNFGWSRARGKVHLVQCTMPCHGNGHNSWLNGLYWTPADRTVHGSIKFHLIHDNSSIYVQTAWLEFRCTTFGYVAEARKCTWLMMQPVAIAFWRRFMKLPRNASFDGWFWCIFVSYLVPSQMAHKRNSHHSKRISSITVKVRWQSRNE